MQNETLLRQNRVLAPIILALTLFFAVLILKPLYTSSIEKMTLESATEANLEKKVQIRDELAKIEASFTSSGTPSDLVSKVKKLDKKFVVSDIMEAVMLNNFTKNTLSSDARISLGSISVNKGSKLPSGLSLGSVSVEVTGVEMRDVINYITYLTTESPYAFTIDSITLPLDTEVPDSLGSTGNFTLALSLGVYYYE